MSDTIVIDGEINLKIALDGEIDSVIKVGHEVVTQPLSVTEDGTYEVPDGVDGYTPVIVAIPPPVVQNKTVEPLTTSQVVEPDEGYDYLSSVTVNGFVPPFNVLPYLTSINSLFKDKTINLDTIVLDFGGARIAGMFQSFYRMSGVRKLVIKNINYPEGVGVACQEVFRDTELQIVEFDNCVFRPANNSYPLMSARIEEFIGYIDMTYRTESLNLSVPIREIRFVPSTIHANFSVSNCFYLSVESLVSIANGFNSETPSTFDIRRSMLLPTIQATMGNVIDGSFIEDENGSMTLESFITTIKGWTIRNA